MLNKRREKMGLYDRDYMREKHSRGRVIKFGVKKNNDTKCIVVIIVAFILGFIIGKII